MNQPHHLIQAHRAYHELALAYSQGGDWESAGLAYINAIACDRVDADAFIGLGAVRMRQERWHDARICYLQATQLRSVAVDAWCGLGAAALRLSAIDEAESSYQRALQLQPDSAPARDGLLRIQQQRAASVAMHAQASAHPELPQAQQALGLELLYQGKFQHAEAYLRRCLVLGHASVALYVGLGYVHYARKDLGIARDWYQAALAIEPEAADAHFHLAILQLACGEFAAGWRGYEYRWRRAGVERYRHPLKPLWTAAIAARGQTVLLHSEQGLGDTLQFVRYVAAANALGVRVVLEVQPQLKRLLQASLPGCAVYATGESLPPFDAQLPLMSLPLMLGEGVPPASYIHAPTERLLYWHDRLGGAAGKRIGLVWAGNPLHSNDRQRSLSLATMLPIINDSEHRWYALQANIPPRDSALLAGCSALTSLAPDLRCFTDTAAVIAKLDLIITVDTCVAHLAGAMGKPVWILLPYLADFRWMLEGESSRWYPSARLFRQNTPGDWGSAVQAVSQALNEVMPAPQLEGPAL